MSCVLRPAFLIVFAEETSTKKQWCFLALDISLVISLSIFPSLEVGRRREPCKNMFLPLNLPLFFPLENKACFVPAQMGNKQKNSRHSPMTSHPTIILGCRVFCSDAQFHSRRCDCNTRLSVLFAVQQFVFLPFALHLKGRFRS
jgi:hypothetical protein